MTTHRVTTRPPERPGVRLACGALALCAVALGSVAGAPLLPAWMGSHDKLVHAVAYAGLMVLLTRVLPDRRAWLAVAIGLGCAGVGIEVLQSLVPTRRCEPLDALANVAGIALAWAVLRGRPGNPFARLAGPVPSAADRAVTG